MLDFTNAIQTANGTKVKEVKFNKVLDKWVGKIWWNESSKEDKFTTATWTKTGKAKNSDHNLKTYMSQRFVFGTIETAAHIDNVSVNNEEIMTPMEALAYLNLTKFAFNKNWAMKYGENKTLFVTTS